MFAAAMVALASIAVADPVSVVAGDHLVMAGDLQVAAHGHEDPRAVKAGDGVAVKIVADEEGAMMVAAIFEDGTTVPLSAMGLDVTVVLTLVVDGMPITAGGCPVLGVEPRHSEIGGVPIEFAVKALCGVAS